MHKSEAMTSVTGRDAVGSQLLSQPLAFTNISVLSEADSPWAGEGLERKETACQCSPEVIYCEVSALKTTRTDPGEVVTSMHGSRGDFVLGERE